MSRSVVSLRLNPTELQFVDRIAAEKGVPRAAALHQLFLQQVALIEVQKAVAAVVDSRLENLRAELENLRTEIASTASRDDLVKATKFIVSECKK